MIIKGNIRTDGKALGDYLNSEGRYAANREKNEHIEIWEANGIEQGDTLQTILADFQHSAAGSQCEKPLFHVQFRTDDGEHLTREQWLESVNRLEKRLELTGHERVIVTHRLNGQDHVHVAWNRMPAEQGNAAELHFYKHKCTDVARELEWDFCLRQLTNNRKRGKLSRDEEQQALRHGKNPEEIKEELRTCWQQADNGRSFAAALDECGYVLAKGDRRDFVIVGSEGEIYGVARVTGAKVAQVRGRLADLDRESLPSVEEARAIQLDRATTRDALKWEDELAKAAIEKAGREERAEKQRQAHEREISITSNLSKTAGEIRLAYGLSGSGQGFANALEDRGLILASVTAEDAQRSELSQKAAKAIGEDPAPLLKEGELVVVNGYGSVYRLNQRTTGDSKAELEKYLSTVDRSELLSVGDAQAVIREVQDNRLGEWELKKDQNAAHRGAKLYDRADMVSTQRDAMRHLKDAHRIDRGQTPLHPDEHQHRQEEAARQQQEQTQRQQQQEQEQDVRDIRRDFWRELRSLKSGQQEQARDDKKDRTEQTDYQQRKAERDAMRENSDVRQGQPARSNEEEGRERERERE